MLNFKKEIAKSISKCTQINEIEIENYIEIPPDCNMGDYAFPCFRLAKDLKKAPQIIANEINEKIQLDTKMFEKALVTGGYLNFFVNKNTFIQNILEEVVKNGENYGKSNIGKNKNIVIDYSSPNIAKPFHIGHLRSTVIGGALYKIYQFLGYNSVGINYLGDWGLQFGKVMAGLSLWKDEYKFEPGKEINTILEIYVRFNKEEKEDESLTALAKQWLKKLEDGDEETVKTWEWIRKLSLENYQKTYDLLNAKFDLYRGEAYYKDKMQDIVDELRKKDLLSESEGALVVDLEKYNMPPCIIITSAGTTIYATRDLASLKDRMNTFDFEKALYVVGSEQQLHFKQIFKVFELMGYEDYAKKCEHIPLGLIVNKDGQKIGSRSGNSVSLQDILNESIEKVYKILDEKNPNLENKDDVAKKVGVGAIIFNDLANSRIKDEIFDWDTLLNFNGETGPYIQYMYVRTKSILNREKLNLDVNNIDISSISNTEGINVIKNIARYTDTVINAAEKNEPSIVARFLLDVAKSYSNFYNEHKIIVDDEQTKNARMLLTYAVNIVLKSGAGLLGIDMPEKM